jgi:hypothetical protein
MRGTPALFRRCVWGVAGAFLHVHCGRWEPLSFQGGQRSLADPLRTDYVNACQTRTWQAASLPACLRGHDGTCVVMAPRPKPRPSNDGWVKPTIDASVRLSTPSTWPTRCSRRLLCWFLSGDVGGLEGRRPGQLDASGTEKGRGTGTRHTSPDVFPPASQRSSNKSASQNVSGVTEADGRGARLLSRQRW